MSQEQFEELSLPRKELPQLSGRYRVYKDARNFIIVEAASALEAFKASGLPQVYRMERDAIYLNNVMTLDEMPKAPAAEAAVAKADDAPAAPQEAADAALSNTDVDKLLKGDAPAAP